MLALIWIQYRQFRWSIAFYFVATAVPFFLVRAMGKEHPYLDYGDLMEMGLFGSSIVMVVFGGLLSSYVVSYEVASNTVHFLRTLPLHAKDIVITKLIFAAGPPVVATCALMAIYCFCPVARNPGHARFVALHAELFLASMLGLCGMCWATGAIFGKPTLGFLSGCLLYVSPAALCVFLLQYANIQLGSFGGAVAQTSGHIGLFIRLTYIVSLISFTAGTAVILRRYSLT